MAINARCHFPKIHAAILSTKKLELLGIDSKFVTHVSKLGLLRESTQKDHLFNSDVIHTMQDKIV